MNVICDMNIALTVMHNVLCGVNTIQLLDQPVTAKAN